MTVLVDIHGSCVSRNNFSLIKDSEVHVNQYFSRNNIVSAMMPSVDFDINHGDLKQYTSEYAERCMSLSLNKDTVPLLINSPASFLVVDFFDFCQPVAAYQQTTFSTYDYTFYNTERYKNNTDKFMNVDFLSLPPSLWYGYVDLYWQKIKSKFQDNIILVRLKCSRQFISKKNTVKPIPQNLLTFGNAKYNDSLHALEDYIIGKYTPYVVDVTKYFMPDENYNPDTTPVHFERSYDLLTSMIIQNIILNNPKQRYFDSLPPNIIAEILERPVSNEDYEKILKDNILPFSSDSFLDDICKGFDLNATINNRKWLSLIYRKYNAYALLMDLKNDSQQNAKILTDFISHILDTTSTDSEEYIQSFIAELKKQNLYLQIPLKNLYDDFLKAFDSGDISWINMLKTLYFLLPNNKNIEYYMLQYYIATDDKINIQKFTLNHNID